QAIDTVRRRVETSSEHAGPIRAILRAAMRLRARSVSDVLIDATSEMGAEATVLSVAFPALREIGRWWDVGSAMVSNEHSATAGVRAWLAAAQLSTDAPVERRPVVLACGPDEMHSIGLEAFELFLVNRGWPCVTLGALTPREEIAAVVRQVDAGGVVITSHQATTRRTAIDALREVRSLRRARVFYAGRAFSSPGARMGVPGIYLGEDLATAADLVDVTIGDNDSEPARTEAS
ncbi:MAG: MerR family transcriptional regulator, light-induced transcriptional regulator, partial [Actinomycetota bacterium]|nr:MerR family transcriptional regulator, light-induced transcriptional regulator [Actinomycetota bacterium]